MSEISKANDIETYVARKISRLEVGDPASKAELARLRRGAGKAVTDVPETWGVTLDGMPEGLSGHSTSDGYEPSAAEIAVHHALTLYAVHMQGSMSSVNSHGTSIGSATRMLIGRTSSDEGVRSRFKALISSADATELSHHLRGIVQLLKSCGGISLDYPHLAKEIYLFSNPDWRGDVVFRWAEDFYPAPKTVSDKNNTEE